jgi:GNAT superfamily N-acetyltransferase
MPFRVAFRVEQVPPDRTYALRHQVLRSHQPLSDIGGPDDDHIAFVALGPDDAVLATAVVKPEPCPWRPEEPSAWRLRGVATAPEARNQGIGTAVLDAVIAHVEAAGGRLLWCNARTPAQTLYERAGFTTEGERWTDPDIGPHIRMWRAAR